MCNVFIKNVLIKPSLENNILNKTEYETNDVTHGKKISKRQKPLNLSFLEFKTTAKTIAKININGTSTIRNRNEFPKELQKTLSWNNRTKLPKPTNLLLSPETDENTSLIELRIG